MSEFISIVYDDKHKAEEARLTLVKLQKEYLIDLEDAVVATKNADGKIKLNQAINLTGAGALSGGFWGTLVGMIFLMPFFGAAVGAATGAIGGALSDIGIDDNYMKELAAGMNEKSSALFVLVRKSTPDKVLPELKKYGGTVLRTSLNHEDETRLRAALEASD